MTGCLQIGHTDINEWMSQQHCFAFVQLNDLPQCVSPFCRCFQLSRSKNFVSQWWHIEPLVFFLLVACHKMCPAESRFYFSYVCTNSLMRIQVKSKTNSFKATPCFFAPFELSNLLPGPIHQNLSCLWDFVLRLFNKQLKRTHRFKEASWFDFLKVRAKIQPKISS